MKLKLEKLLPLGYLLSLPLLGQIYNLLNQDNGKVYSLVTDLDKLIPFNKYFVVPYVLWLPFIFFMLAYFCFKDREIYLKTLIGINLGLMLNFLIYSAFQTTVPRPEVLGSDLFDKAIRWIYTMDQPYNCFPSGHVLTSYAIMYGCCRVKDFNKKVLTGVKIMAAAIILSTQFLKQHVLLDAVAGIIQVNLIMSFIETVKWEECKQWLQGIYLLLTTKLR